MNILPRGALPYMVKPREQFHVTEAYVSSPPALIIYAPDGDTFCLGNKIQAGPTGEYAFDIRRNGFDTGEVGSRIEMRGGKIRVFTLSGWKHWTGRSFV